MAHNWLRIGEVAQHADVSVDTIRYYERRQLLATSPRSEGGFRLFAPDTIERVRFIKQAQAIGFSLDEIRTLLTGSGGSTCEQVRDLLQIKMNHVNERINALRAFRRMLGSYLQACEAELARKGSKAKCPVVVEIGHAARELK